MRIKKKRRLSNQLTLFVFVILVINTCVVVSIVGTHFKNEYITLMQERVETVGLNLKTFMEDILGLGLPIGSLEGVDKELEKTVSGDLRAEYANVVDRHGLIIYSFPEIKDVGFFNASLIVPLLKNNEQKTFLTGTVYNTFIPIEDPFNNEVVGGINIGMSENYVYSKTIDTLDNLIYIFLGFIVITLVFMYGITKSKIKPLEALAKGAVSLGSGDLSARAHIKATNEIGFLATSFNDMAERLQEDRKKLINYTDELERRNQKLQRAHEEILHRERKLRDAQSQLVLSEKMASLGLLIAGVAHEINTPAGAVANVASDLGGRVAVITKDMMKIHDLTYKELELLEKFADKFTNTAFADSTGNQWKKSRETRNWFREMGIENENALISQLSKYNLLDKEQLIPYEDIIKKPWVIEMLDSLGTINNGMKICESSIKKISEIVKALKYYAYTDMDNTSLVDINENIQNVLVLMHNKMKYSMEIEKELKPVPRIHCTSEINQVWTNLLSNAHDAIMDSTTSEEKGKINISTEESDGMIKVRITDNGAGFSEETAKKMFDPFYTTKGIGKGTGLGLSIVSGIVKKHKGDIAVESNPGETMFTVSLPISSENGGSAHES